MKKTISIAIILTATVITIFSSYISNAQPYGKGTYGNDLPYGNMTSLSISTDEDINIPITPTNEGVLATGLSTVTVTSTDVVGYKLYIRALDSASMNNLGDLIPASSNISPSTLATNTWGYNTDGTNNFTGITLGDVLIRSSNVPVSSGEITQVTYGISLDLAKPAGNYTANIVYTAVPQTN